MKSLSFVSALSFAGVLGWAMLDSSALGADVHSYLVQKGIQYVQSTPDNPVPDANNGAIFEARVKTTETNLITSATLQLPDGASAALPQDGSDEFKLKEKYDKQTGLDSHFPNGTYTLTFYAAHDGPKSLALALTGNLYPNTPWLSNYAAAQQVDAGSYSLYAWDTLSTGGTNDFVQLHIEDSQGNKVFETPDFAEAGALDGRAGSVLVPPRTLAAGQTYEATLYFAKAAARDLTSYPGAIGGALYYKRTKFPVKTVPQATEATVKLYGVAKMRRFQQTDPGAPGLQTTRAGNIDLVLASAAAGSVSKVSVTLPSGASKALELDSDNKTFEFSDDATTPSGLDATYPDGVYQLWISSSGTGSKTPVLNLTGALYPKPPHIANFGAIADASSDFVVSWDPFEGGSATDFIQLHIEDPTGNKIFETPDFAKSGALNGLATSAVVPKDALLPGRAYNARVAFQKNLVLDSTSYPGALGYAAYISRTSFKLSTSGASGEQPPALTVLPFSHTGSFRFQVQAAAGQVLQVESSEDLRQWTKLSTNTLPATGQLEVSDDQAKNTRFRYYRAVLGP